MATPVAPAAPAAPQPVPDPAPTAPPSALAQIFTPVQPARPTGDAQPLGSTSALRQTADSDTTSSSGNSRDGGKDGPVGALVRALAARLGRTGTTRTIKRTHDVKETRNSGNSTTTTNANKHDRANRNDSSAQHRSNRDAKLADLKNKVQQHQGKDTRDARTANTRDAKSDRSAKTADSRDAKKADARDAKTADLRDAKTAGSTSAKSDRSAKTADGRDLKKSDSSTTAKAGTSGGGAAKSSEATAKPGAAEKTLDPTVKPPSAAGRTEPGKDTGKPATEEKTPAGTAATDGKTTPVSLAKKPLRTRSSREAGYRDGQRAAGAVGHVQAWRDGTRDGWDDRQAANQAERKKMDTARARNAIRPETPANPPMAPASGSTADLRKKQNDQAAAASPVPAQVTDIGESAIRFTAAGAQHTLSRGEVRTLKAFERRLAEKKTALQKITEGSKDTLAAATTHAAKAQKLAEDAKGVKGGDPLIRILLRLAEQAQALRGKAEDIQKKAGRGAEALTALAANANTRHGVIYKAVVDSPLTSPAERDFYQDKQGS